MQLHILIETSVNDRDNKNLKKKKYTCKNVRHRTLMSYGCINTKYWNELDLGEKRCWMLVLSVTDNLGKVMEQALKLNAGH
jgi:hypothetical protein